MSKPTRKLATIVALNSIALSPSSKARGSTCAAQRLHGRGAAQTSRANLRLSAAPLGCSNFVAHPLPQSFTLGETIEDLVH